MNIKKIRLKINFISIGIFSFVLVFTFVFYSLFGVSYATSTGTVYLSSSKTIIEKGEEIEITLLIENAKTAAYNINLYFNNTKLEYISGPENTNVVENRIISVWYDQAGENDAKEGELVKYVFRAKEEGTANFYIQGEFYDGLGNSIETNFKETQVQIGKEETVMNQTNQTNNFDIANNKTENTNMGNTNLETLAIENVLLYPPFDTNVINYNIEISNETSKLNILAVPENEKASVQITGNNDLKEGENLIKITVTAQDGLSKKVFEINCYKRNSEEEILYQKEQEENRKKLEEIYQAEKISSQTGEAGMESKKEVEKKVAWIVLIVIGVNLVLFWMIWKRKNNVKH